MEFSLSKYLTIEGVGAASGILKLDNVLFLISDKSTFLYRFDLVSLVLERIPIVNDALESIEKKVKPDLESMALNGNKIVLYGSGSTKKRCRKFTYHLNKETVKIKSLAKLYNSFIDFAAIETKNLNIEGVVLIGDQKLFFQRGNGLNAPNGIFVVVGKRVIDFRKIDLPIINDVMATFTDAIVVGKLVYFLAAAENTDSTYNDGEILGSYIGWFGIDDFKIQDIILISDNQKFEGLTLFESTDYYTSFLLCADNDDDSDVAVVHELRINTAQ